MSVDLLDLRIIKSLSNNARKPYSTVAKELDISDATVRKRVKRMLEDGVIRQFNVLVDYHMIGKNVKAFIGLRVATGKLKEVVGHLEKNDDVVVLYRTTGNVELFAEVVFRDMEELKTFLESELDHDGISYSEVTVVIGPYKRCPSSGL
jgi:Lrp/AsnC family transcriptional regulator, regulator for asnA, asnC and gidA